MKITNTKSSKHANKENKLNKTTYPFIKNLVQADESWGLSPCWCRWCFLGTNNLSSVPVPVLWDFASACNNDSTTDILPIRRPLSIISWDNLFLGFFELAPDPIAHWLLGPIIVENLGKTCWQRCQFRHIWRVYNGFYCNFLVIRAVRENANLIKFVFAYVICLKTCVKLLKHAPYAQRAKRTARSLTLYIFCWVTLHVATVK